MTPQQVDVDAMLSSAPLGSIDFEVAELTQRITHDSLPYVDTEPVGLLDATVVVAVEWANDRYTSLYDGAGRLIAIVTAPGVPRGTYYFMEAGGVTFSIHAAPAGSWTPHGRPSAAVVVESSGELIGTYGDGFCAGSEGQLLGTVRRTDDLLYPTEGVVHPDGRVLARLWLSDTPSGYIPWAAGKTPNRRYRSSKATQFYPGTGPEVRGLTLAYTTKTPYVPDG